MFLFSTLLATVDSTYTQDTTCTVYNFEVENTHNYFVGHTAVLVHNAHEGLLGKITKSYTKVANKLKDLSPEVAARLEEYIKEYGGNNIDAFLKHLNNNSDKLDELAERLRRTAEGTFRKFETNELNIGSYSKMVNDYTKGIDNLTPHHIPSDGYMLEKGFEGYSKVKGLCIVVESSSITGQIKPSRHGRTKSFGKTTDATKKEYYNMSPKDALKRDIDDLREIYISDGIYNANVEKALEDLVKQTKVKYSPFFD